MKFGNRFSGRSDALARERHERYLRHIGQDFAADDPVYQYFGGDVFHDSPVIVERVDLEAGSIDFRLRNVYAVDRISHTRIQAGLKQLTTARLHADCSTLVTFEGVDSFQFNKREGKSSGQYFSSEISKSHTGYLIEIYIYVRRAEFDRVRIACRQVTIEDITPRLRKHLPPTLFANDMVTWLGK